MDHLAGDHPAQLITMTQSTPRSRVVPRGIRNNNPLNIRIGNVWLGEVSNPTDPDFEQFVSMEYGLRAAFVLLRRYINHYKRQTITEIISAWAPSTENLTQKYIDHVLSQMHLDSETLIRFEDAATMVRLVDAMAYHECGQHVPIDKIKHAYWMA